MIRLTPQTLAVFAAVGLLLAPVAVAAQTPAPAPARKLISPVRGEAKVEITRPDTKVVGGNVVTVIMLKNTSTAPIAGLKIEENWFDKSNNPSGGDVYRHGKPLMVGEVVKITLTTPKKPTMQSNKYDFSHANGAIKPTVVPKLEVPTS